ncbi:cytotoxic and regulatory T-cell molecule isoform X1 [Rana temporaria]|uniref:cytotoxic and regulatory T-cell molecule isoform X1 n=1 Tax=Rana temporaria TaxID=8407 RepID=UPI001AAE01C7|nr:cytotoxic and regulatory T-cell molecule isoform X1 [Rana temporaria]
MIVFALLCVLGALLKGEAKVLYSRVSVEEGRTLILRCAFPGSNSSAMQWLTPRGYVTFFNSEKVLKDRRLQLIRSSRNRLVISISNITRDDEGVYTCLHYSMPVKAKEVNVTVRATPSQPIIEVVQISRKSSKDEIVLNCSTSGGRPCPRITWLVGHTELSGNRKASFQGDDKKCTASSTLRINAFTHRSTVTCVVRHRSFSMGNSTATFNFSNLLTATEAGNTPIDQTTAHVPHSAEVTTSMISSEQSFTGGYGVTTTGGEEGNPTTDITSMTYPEWNTTLENPMTGEDKEDRTNATGRETLPAGDITTQQNETTEAVTYSAFTDINTTWYIQLDNVTGISQSRTAEFEASRGKSNSTVILILVSLMICVLLVTVHLFLMKLKKAHEAWKKENENSDQTLESNKSKSNNEDAPGPVRNGQGATNQNGSGIKYNSQVSM